MWLYIYVVYPEHFSALTFICQLTIENDFILCFDLVLILQFCFAFRRSTLRSIITKVLRARTAPKSMGFSSFRYFFFKTIIVKLSITISMKNDDCLYSGFTAFKFCYWEFVVFKYKTFVMRWIGVIHSNMFANLKVLWKLKMDFKFEQIYGKDIPKSYCSRKLIIIIKTNPIIMQKLIFKFYK